LRRLVLFVCALLLAASPAFAQTFTLQERTLVLSAATTTAVVPVRGEAAVILLDIVTITTADGDDEVDFYVQTTYDGTSWVDLANVHVATADDGTTQKTVVVIGSPAAGIAQLDDPTDGTLADDTNADIPMGIALRIKTAITGATAPSYAFIAKGLWTGDLR